MVQNLINYVQQQLKNGYTPQQIKKALIKYGYPKYQIDQAFSSTPQTKPKPVKPINPKLTKPKINLNLNFLKNLPISKNTIFIAIAILILILGTTIVLNISKQQTTSTTPSLTLSAITTTVPPGETISFMRQMHNLESYELEISYFLTDQYNNIIKTEYETITHSTPSKKEINIPIEMKLGTYTLRAETTYNNQQLTYTIPIKIYQQTESTQETCFDSIKNQDETTIDCGGICGTCLKCPESCDDNDECTIDECSPQTDYQCIHTEIGGCQTPPQQQSPSPPQYREGEIVTLNSIRKELTATINSNPQQAAQLCNQVTDIIERSVCFSTVAELSGISSYCAQIERPITKDACYMHFVINLNETQHCDIIQDDYLKDSCETIKRIKEIQQQYPE